MIKKKTYFFVMTSAGNFGLCSLFASHFFTLGMSKNKTQWLIWFGLSVSLFTCSHTRSSWLPVKEYDRRCSQFEWIFAILKRFNCRSLTIACTDDSNYSFLLALNNK